MIDLMSVEPNVPNAEFENYVFTFYGNSATGKTRFLTSLPDSLLLGLEQGFQMLPGVLGISIKSYTDFLSAVSQLVGKPELRKKYKYIGIDSLTALVAYATDHVLETEGINELGDLAYGKGYAMTNQLIIKQIRRLLKYYTVVFVAHSLEKRDENDEELKYATLNLPVKITDFIIQNSDLVGFLYRPRDGSQLSVMKSKASPSWVAKSRFSLLPETVEFNPKEVMEAVKTAIIKETEMAGIQASTKSKELTVEKEITVQSFQDLKNKLMKDGQEFLAEFPDYLEAVKNKIKDIIGNKQLSDVMINDYQKLVVLENEFGTLFDRVRKTNRGDKTVAKKELKE